MAMHLLFLTEAIVVPQNLKRESEQLFDSRIQPEPVKVFSG
jgi:hypothetical protein